MYLNLEDVKNEHSAIKDLTSRWADKYSDLRDSLFELRKMVDGEDTIRIPPIALEALNAAKNLECIGEELLEIRDKYRKVRIRFAENRRNEIFT